MKETENQNSQSNGGAAPNPDALMDLVGQMVGDMGAAVSGSLVVLGDRVGIYRALAKAGPCTETELAEASGLDARYLREWLSNQAASGYVSYDAASNRFYLSPEQVAVFADPDSPVSMIGGYYALASTYHDEPMIAKAFESGDGIPWQDHHDCLFCGTEKFFRPGYAANLTSSWIPSLDGVGEKLAAGGARVADVGCGYGASTIIMAQAFPESEFVGFDLHGASLEHARSHAEGLPNLRFEEATAKEYPTGDGFDLVTIFDALHDMGDPVGACAHIRDSLRPGGTMMLVEPMAGDALEENINPVGRLYYGFSTMVCTPGSRSQEVGAALGAQAGEARLRGVVEEAGFSKFRRSAETPFNLILEAKV
ncbi:MAG: methyltransferase domain-containing protein [Verrucomicrobiales bacterium]